ncbi:hypothetical protein BU25DRAFT_454846 [Macroventuria anomochaeta]|uniref:Uncharacterized protein n=1 Tax=Macroventuria anomochaeta TaxID=301207 RepID=A0ACB6SBP3_9PLEO|nr:uncharacterized protein BU25DRAFT_454846 [Macroventuria anomochaeta]KAF2631393.1 hypothetical protein BU25DRAFT_454846 [Macroventuria anomochaeta]
MTSGWTRTRKWSSTSRFTVKQTYDKLQPKRTFTPHISNHHNSASECNADIAIHGPQSARHGWEWYEMGFFACWTKSGSVTLLCFDLPAKLRSDIQSMTWPQDVSLSCPYAVFPQVLDALLRLYDDSVWAIRNHISQWEARRLVDTDYFLLHEIARHGVHVSETLSVAIRSLDAMQHHHERFRANNDLARSKNGRRRWDKAFNAAAQRDSMVQLQIGEEAKREASAMKAIAVVSMTFLPAPFVSTIFGTNFFSFEPDRDAGQPLFAVSRQFWVYWALSVPLTVATLALPVRRPAVHFGNIASSNQLQISAVESKRVQREHDVICFEMEAAGVMDEYPCVVVRGICDYADSHKNKGWQNYAAATVAALQIDPYPSTLQAHRTTRSARAETAPKQSSLTGVRLRVFLTSRPEVPIRHGFGQVSDTEHKDVVLHNILPSIIDHDISTFLEHHLRFIVKESYQDADWPGAEVIRLLVQHASSLFIWAATACLFVREGLFPDVRLRILVECSISRDVAAPEEQLNKMYLTVLQTLVQPGYSTHETTMYYTMLRLILGGIVVFASPLSIRSSGALLVPKHRMHCMLKDLHAILNILEDPLQPLRLHHPSFRDFLLSIDRCSDDSFWVDERSTQEKLAFRCLQLMSAPNGLRQDICGLSKPGTLRSEIEEEVVASSLLPELQYACRYWVEHLERSQHSIADGDTVHVFLQMHLLHWLEAMSLIGETSQCVRLLARLQALVAYQRRISDQDAQLDHPHMILTTIPPTSAVIDMGTPDMGNPFKESPDYFAFDMGSSRKKKPEHGGESEMLHIEDL